MSYWLPLGYLSLVFVVPFVFSSLILVMCDVWKVVETGSEKVWPQIGVGQAVKNKQMPLQSTVPSIVVMQEIAMKLEP